MQGVEHRLAALLDQRLNELLELAAGDRDLHVLRAALVGGDERQIDGRFHRGGKLDLGLLGGFLQSLKGHRIFAKIDAFGALEFVGQEVDQHLVEVIAAEVGVAVDGEHFEDAVADIEHRHVERAAAQIEDADLFVLLLVQPVRQGGGGRLGQHAEHLQSGDFAGVLGGLALGIVEVSRHGDDRVGDLLAEIVFGRLLQVLQDERGDLLGRVVLAANFHLHEFFGPADDLRTGPSSLPGRLRCAGGP